MALAAATNSNALVPPGLQSVCPTSAMTTWVTVVSDATATAATATELITPKSFAGSNCKWLRIGPGGRKMALRAKYTIANDMTTAPICYIIGAFVDPAAADPSPQFATDDTVRIMRLDNPSGSVGITIARVAASDQRDTTFRYTDPAIFTSPFTGVIGDLFGASHVLVLCSQAAVSAGAVTIEASLFN